MDWRKCKIKEKINANIYTEKLKVGFRERSGTFEDKPAYVIYYKKGKLCKEKSFEGWRDKKIDTVESDNVPTTGFMLNKGHTRYSWSSFGGKTSVIRIYDPRGWE